MKDNDEQISEGLNQLFEIINAKGDIGEINQILEQSKNSEPETDKGTTES